MQNNPILVLFLPLALGVVMMGLGLHLTMADFRRVWDVPRAVLVALLVQTLVLPPVAFGLAMWSGMPPEMAVGLVLLSAAPGGVTANLFSHIAKGDVALNVTLTAINSMLALVTLPLWVALGMRVFLGVDGSVPPPGRKIVEVAVLVVGPVAIGMLVRRYWSAIAAKLERPVRLLSTLVLVVLIVVAFVSEWDLVTEHAPRVGVIMLAFNVISLLAGYGAARLARLELGQATAIAFEIGIHNSTVAIFIALEVLGVTAAGIPAGLYSLSMYVTAGLFAAWILRGQAPGPRGL
jgi:bile acid:Na+ symporter, BASS family